MAPLPKYIADLLRDPANSPLTNEREDELGEVISAAREARKLEVISPKLEREERRAKDELTRRSVRLVVTIAHSYKHRVEIEELIGAGNVALVRAVNLWDPNVGPLAPWVIRWIRSAMTRTVDASRTIRIPEELAYRGAIVAKTKTELEHTLGRSASIEELAEELGTNVGELERIEALPYATTILDAPLSKENGNTLSSMLEDSTYDPTATVEGIDLRERLIEACKELTPHEARIIVARFDLAETGLIPTLNELGDELGFSREMVRRLEASALAKLRHPALKIALDELS